MPKPQLKPVRVVITDDSELATRALSRIIKGTPDIEVVGVAHSLRDLEELLPLARPDAVTLDLLMPLGTALSAIPRLARDVAVVVVSDSEEDSPLAREALAQGAVAYFSKRELADADGRARLGRALLSSRSGQAPPPIVAIAGSTGAMPAFERVLPELAQLDAALLILQHLPPERIASFTAWLCSLGLSASGAEEGAPLCRQHAYVAQGDRHLALGPGERLRCLDAPPVGGHRPSADVLFESLVPYASRATAVVLSGMGADGAAGAALLAAAGGQVIVQHPDDCAVASMPERTAEAAGRGARVVRVGDLAATIRFFAQGHRRRV